MTDSESRTTRFVEMVLRFLAWREHRRQKFYKDSDYSPPSSGILPILVLAILWSGYVRLKEVILGD